MLTDFKGADHVYIACGYTDLRRGIDGLASLVQQEFQLDPFRNTLFLFVSVKFPPALPEHRGSEKIP